MFRIEAVETTLERKFRPVCSDIWIAIYGDYTLVFAIYVSRNDTPHILISLGSLNTPRGGGNCNWKCAFTVTAARRVTRNSQAEENIMGTDKQKRYVYVDINTNDQHKNF